MSTCNLLPRLAPDAGDPQFEEVVAWAAVGARRPDEIADLARQLADSGSSIQWEGGPVCDVASTGGPGSLSTLVSPLMLRSFGCRVVKLAVPGRPAGAIDAFGTIPGYRTRLTLPEVREITGRCGFSHFVADDVFAPLDARLFDYRRRAQAVNVPALAIASILSKKLAVGVDSVGLDVRVGPHGNFGTTHAEARENTSLFCRTARILGIRAVGVVSAEGAVAQPWIGRGEALVALAHAVGLGAIESAGWLSGHIEQCAELVRETVPAPRQGRQTMDANTMREQLATHLEAQGSSWRAFEQRVHGVLTEPRAHVSARSHGLLAVDLAVLRDVLVALQAPRSSGVFDDPGGVQLLRPPGVEVQANEAIAVVRMSDPARLDEICRRVDAAFSVENRMTRVDDKDEREVVRA